MPDTMRRKISSVCKRMAYTTVLLLTTFILTIGIATTARWLYSDSGTTIGPLYTLQCNLYSDSTTACTLGRDNSQVKVIILNTLYDHFFSLAITAWSSKASYQTHHLVKDHCAEHYPMFYIWVLGGSDSDYDALVFISPHPWIPTKSTVIIWAVSVVMAAILVVVVCIRMQATGLDEGTPDRVIDSGERRLEVYTEQLTGDPLHGYNDGSVYRHL